MSVMSLQFQCLLNPLRIFPKQPLNTRQQSILSRRLKTISWSLLAVRSNLMNSQ